MPEDLKARINAALDRWRERQYDLATEAYANCMLGAETQKEIDDCQTAFFKRLNEIDELYEKMKKMRLENYKASLRKK